MFIEDLSGGSDQDDKPNDQNVNSLDVLGARSSGSGPSEVIPVGVRTPAPETDDPIYYRAVGDDGKSVTVGPFKLTAQQIRDFKEGKSAGELDEYVQRRQLRSGTALAMKSDQFDTILSMMEAGQKPSETMIKRFLGGDLQRLIEAERRHYR